MTAGRLSVEAWGSINERNRRSAVKADREFTGCALPTGEIADTALKGIVLWNFENSLRIGQ